MSINAQFLMFLSQDPEAMEDVARLEEMGLQVSVTVKPADALPPPGERKATSEVTELNWNDIKLLKKMGVNGQTIN